MVCGLSVRMKSISFFVSALGDIQVHLLLAFFLKSVFTNFNQSINRSKLYSANIPGKARLSGATAKSVFNRKIEETVPQHQQAMGSDGIYGGKAKSKRCVFRYFLKIATELAERTDSDRLFQRDRAQE